MSGRSMMILRLMPVLVRLVYLKVGRAQCSTGVFDIPLTQALSLQRSDVGQVYT